MIAIWGFHAPFVILKDALPVLFRYPKLTDKFSSPTSPHND